MQSRDYWIIGSAAALLGIIVTVLFPRETAATVRDFLREALVLVAVALVERGGARHINLNFDP